MFIKLKKKVNDEYFVGEWKLFNNGPDDTNLVNRLGIKLSLTKWDFPWWAQRRQGHITNKETGNVLGVRNYCQRQDYPNRCDLNYAKRNALIGQSIEEQEKNDDFWGQRWTLGTPDVFGYFKIIIYNNLFLNALNESHITVEGMLFSYRII